jgi:hypothetical protein
MVLSALSPVKVLPYAKIKTVLSHLAALENFSAG